MYYKIFDYKLKSFLIFNFDIKEILNLLGDIFLVINFNWMG